MKLIASNQLTLTNLLERAIDRTEVTFWHGLSATKHPLGIYDCGGRNHYFGNEFNVTSGKTYTVRVIAKQTKGSIQLAGGIWYTAMTSGYAWDGYAPFTLVGEASEDGLGIYERKVVVASGKTKGMLFIQLEQTVGGYSTAYRIYDGQVFDENGQPLVTDQNNLGTLTSPMAAPDGTYIWKRTITYYTDGTNDTVWEYNGIGVKGTDGKTQYTHIAYADNATGGGFSQTDQTKAYIGMYQDFTVTDSTDPTKYRWTKWKGSDGAQGVPGKPGADGKTPYIHFAYADDKKGTNFSLTDNNQQYQGYYSDYTQADSTDYTKYKWVDRLANVQVGNKNLILKSNDLANPHKQSGANTTVTSTDDYFVIKSTGYTANAWGGMSWNMSISEMKAGEQFSILMPVYIDSSVDLDNGWAFALKNHTLNPAAYNYDIPSNKKDQWFNVAITFKTYKDVVFDTYPFYVYLVKNGLVRIKPPMLVRGNVIPTDWSPAPEDTQAQIDSKADSGFTQAQLNALAEKNNLIKAEMEAKATIDTVNQWITAYQNYVNANDADKAKSEQALKDASERILAIRYEVNNLKVVWDAIDTYMSFQNEGLVIGKKDGSAYAKFSDDRISLFSGSSEVMYISQGTLNIANGIFTKTIQIGRFRFETHPADADMLVVRFVGG